jgi:hypothetical protein
MHLRHRSMAAGPNKQKRLSQEHYASLTVKQHIPLSFHSLDLLE